MMDYDVEKLCQVFYNLFFNVFKFMFEFGEVVVVVSVLQNVYFEMIVKDIGKGIFEDYLDKIFNCFYQLDDLVICRIGGIGIGLVLVKELVELMEGYIFVESKVGRGIVFFVCLLIYWQVLLVEYSVFFVMVKVI